MTQSRLFLSCEFTWSRSRFALLRGCTLLVFLHRFRHSAHSVSHLSTLQESAYAAADYLSLCSSRLSSYYIGSERDCVPCLNAIRSGHLCFR